MKAIDQPSKIINQEDIFPFKINSNLRKKVFSGPSKKQKKNDKAKVPRHSLSRHLYYRVKANQIDK
jgi:hypothetical protein